MIKLMKYLKKSAGYIVLIIGLLFLQAYCDLSLPDYTSKVINVGIQQGGIPDGVPEKMRQSTMENLQIFMDEDTQKEVQDSYVLDGDTYELKDGITGDKREELNDLLCKPLMMYTSFTSGSEESQKMLSQMHVRIRTAGRHPGPDAGTGRNGPNAGSVSNAGGCKKTDAGGCR